MPIPNIPSLYKLIATGAEGGHEFARIMNLLFTAYGNERNYETIICSDASGDYKGVDSILRRQIDEDRVLNIGIQYKFFPSSLSGAHKQQIKSSLLKAIQKFPEMKVWRLITPQDFLKKDREWFAVLQKEYEGEVIPGLGGKKFIIEHWGQTHITGLMLQYPEIGRLYYRNELFSHEAGTLTLAYITIDSTKINWYKGQYNFIYNQKPLDKNKSSELIFDFHFINNTDLIYLLSQIEVVIEDTWTEVKGIKNTHIVKSIGTIECDMDFNKPVNLIDLISQEGSAITFKPRKPIRFSVQLTDFIGKCPGNMAQIHFNFRFNSTSIKSQSYILSL